MPKASIDHKASLRGTSQPPTRVVQLLICVSLLSAAACSQLFSRSIPRAVLDSCIATRDITGDHPIEQAHLSVLTDRFSQRGDEVRWEPTQAMSGIIRIAVADQLTHRTSRLALEVQVEPTSVAGCNDQLATITRVQSDDQTFDAFETSQFVNTSIRAIQSQVPITGKAPLIPPPHFPLPGTKATSTSPNAFLAASLIPDGKPQLGNCHMGECSWSIVQSTATVRADARGRLVRLVELGGASANETSTVSWEKAPHDVFVFCSTKLPAVIVRDGNGWQVDVLDFVSGPPDVEMSSATTYSTTCHGQDMLSSSMAQQLGYSSIPEHEQNISVTAPLQIFDKTVA